MARDRLAEGGELISNYLPQAGVYGAWLGSYDMGSTESDELFQDVAVPAGTTYPLHEQRPSRIERAVAA